jgi:type I restriction enzyme S subunit
MNGASRMAPNGNHQPTHGWLAESPRGWPVLRLRYCAAINPSRSEVNGLQDDTEVSFVPMEAVSEYGGLHLDQTRTLGEVATGYTYFREGDVVVAKITPCFENGKGAIAEGLTNGLGFGTTELHVLRPLAPLDRKFLFYLTISHTFRSIGSAYMYGAGGQKRVPDDFVRDFRHPIPPVEEQGAIARFLDRETARIDALIEKKRRQIELLQEKRAALISHAVTKGLDPSVKMKDSGIEWLGAVPAQWQHRKLGYLVTVEGGCTPSKANSDYWVGDIPWVSPKDMKTRIVSDSEDHVSEEAVRNSSLRLLDPPVVLIVVRGMILAHTFPVALTTVPVTVNQDMKALRPKPGCSAQYLAYLLEGISSLILSLVEESAHGTKCLRTEIWKGINLFLPSPAEQADICEELERQNRRIDLLVEQIDRSTDRLREYRTALITAAVTGKIDVRKEVA